MKCIASTRPSKTPSCRMSSRVCFFITGRPPRTLQLILSIRTSQSPRRLRHGHQNNNLLLLGINEQPLPKSQRRTFRQHRRHNQRNRNGMGNDAKRRSQRRLPWHIRLSMRAKRPLRLANHPRRPSQIQSQTHRHTHRPITNPQ